MSVHHRCWVLALHLPLAPALALAAVRALVLDCLDGSLLDDWDWEPWPWPWCILRVRGRWRRRYVWCCLLEQRE